MMTRRTFVGLLAAVPAARAAGAEAPAPASDPRITHAKIHPAIGIARVGNSREGFFVGPETPHAPTLAPGQYKDAAGALKRQAAQFRIYGYNAAGEAVRELTVAEADIAWTVHLANKKAAWYQFHLALDIPEAALPGAARARLRNPSVRGANRAQLVIDPGPRTIRGRSTQGPAHQFDGGKFFGLAVPLGELRTTAEGRLLVLGGHGTSRSRDGSPPLEFANNDGWHDDTSDGPVDATVTFEGRALPVEGAWVVAAPPNYAPGLKTVRTLYDLLYDCMVAWGYARAPEQVSFSAHIAPIFERLTGLQWVNRGFAETFGAGALYDADALRARLADAGEANRAFRRQLYEKFRNPREGRFGKTLWPEFYGDAVDSFTTYEADPTLRLARGMSQLSSLQLEWLRRWAAGDFVSDLGTAPAPPAALDAAPVRDQPALLDEAALAFCLADAFHPGCELTWIMRRPSLYNGWLRLRRRAAGAPERDYGAVLLPAFALADDGPLAASGPGDLTRWMSIPWQTDTADCLWSYDFFRTSPDLPTYWPARVPNQVLSERDYRRALDTSLPLARRREAFATRRNWLRGLRENDSFAHMVADYYKLGIVEKRPGAPAGSGLPAEMFVESAPALPLPEDAAGAP